MTYRHSVSEVIAEEEPENHETWQSLIAKLILINVLISCKKLLKKSTSNQRGAEDVLCKLINTAMKFNLWDVTEENHEAYKNSWKRRDSVVGIATRCGLEGQAIESR